MSTLAVLTAPDASRDGRFGTAVAIAPGWLLVGADTQIVNFERKGAAYLWRATVDASGGSVTYVRRLIAPESSALKDDHFGAAVAIHAGQAIVGASGPTYYPAGILRASSNGAVYVFELESGALVTKLMPVDTATGTLALGCFGFGSALAIVGRTLAISAPRARGPCAPGPLWGAAWLFETVGWNQTGKLIPPLGAPRADRAQFGAALALRPHVDGSVTLIAGAPNANAGSSGALYEIGPLVPGDAAQQAAVAGGDWANAPLLGESGPSGTGRFGHAIAVDPSSGIALIGAPVRPHATSAHVPSCHRPCALV